MLSHNETLGKTKAYIFNKELKTVPYVRHMQQYDHFGGVYLVNGDLDSETLLNMLEPALTRGKQKNLIFCRAKVDWQVQQMEVYEEAQ